MKKCLFILFTLFLLNTLPIVAQVKDIFAWKEGKVITNSFFIDNPDELFKLEPDGYNIKRSYLEVYNGIEYTIDLLYSESETEDTYYYDAFVIKRKDSNKEILKTEGTYGTMYFNVQDLTAGASKAPYLILPLDSTSFALILSGLQYTCSDALEMMIVVITGDKADVVFDSPAHVCKYTPYPNYSIEYVVDVDWKMTIGGYVPPASVLNKLKRFKIWQEGNILKYKPLN